MKRSIIHLQRLALLCALCTAVLLFQQSAFPQKPRGKPVVVKGNIATVSAIRGEAYPPEVQRRLKAFNEVWYTIKERYFDPSFGGLDWDKVRRDYEPRAKASKSDAELHSLLQSMISLLKVSHLEIIPPEIYRAIENVKKEARKRERARLAATKPKDEVDSADDPDLEENFDGTDARYGIGIDLKLIDDKFVISRVDPGSTAEKAGLKLGLGVEKINGVSLQAMLSVIAEHYGTDKYGSIRNLLPAEIVELILNSSHGLPVDITYSDVTNSIKDISVPRELIKDGTLVTIFPSLPKNLLEVESRSLGDKVGYFRFDHFALPVIGKFCAAIDEHKSKDAMIIDIRGNSGGLLATLPLLAGMLSPNSTQIGTMKYRASEESLVGKSLPKHFSGRIVVLVDGGTASAGEIFAMLLREHGRAVVVGQRTAGAALPSTIVRLSTGAMFLYPIASYRSAKGKYLEGTGLEPDVKIALDRASLINGKDPQLDSALKLAQDEGTFAALVRSERVPIEDTSAPMPPPPPPAAKPAKKVPQLFTIPGAPVVEAPRDFKPGHDKAASALLDAFIAKIGGKEALRRLSSYSLEGVAAFDISGAKITFQAKLFRQAPDRYAEHLIAESAGETRQLIEGKKSIVQSEFGINTELSTNFDLNEIDPLGIFFQLANAETQFPSLQLTGEYDRSGRKTSVLEGRDKNGQIIALAFDSETKLLVNVSGTVRNVSFGDYRQVGDMQLPFQIDRSGFPTTITSLVVNKPIDNSNFERRQYCYDRP